MKSPEEAKKVEEIQKIRSRKERSFQIAELAKSILSEHKSCQKAEQMYQVCNDFLFSFISLSFLYPTIHTNELY